MPVNYELYLENNQLLYLKRMTFTIIFLTLSNYWSNFLLPNLTWNYVNETMHFYFDEKTRPMCKWEISIMRGKHSYHVTN